MTTTQLEALLLLFQGLRPCQIADKLGLSRQAMDHRLKPERQRARQRMLNRRRGAKPHAQSVQQQRDQRRDLELGATLLKIREWATDENWYYGLRMMNLKADKAAELMDDAAGAGCPVCGDFMHTRKHHEP